MKSADPTVPARFVASDFPADPKLQCDVVMKGGITSGVIYPLAVCELATTYRLRSVGGASAGAIAAAVAAAAELGRRTGPSPTVDVDVAPVAGSAAPVPEAGGSSNENARVTLPRGYLGLAGFPELLTQPQADGQSLLFHLFRPQPRARHLFGLATGAIAKVSRLPNGSGAKPPVVKTLAGLAIGLMKSTLGRSLLGAVLGLTLVVLAVSGLVGLRGDAHRATVVALALAILVGLLVSVLGALIGAVTGLLTDLWALPEIDFGMSSGRGEDDSELALTPWLDRRLQELSGKGYDQPLVMGDLWQQEIKLQAMTTNLSRAQPMVMPWDDHTYFFDPVKFEELFGKAVRDAMCAEGAAPDPPADPLQAARWQLLLADPDKKPFPRAERLPVIVATRMSLSFPLLISAVPLYTVDWDRPANQRYETAASGSPRGDLEWDVNWFSDGGLTSNLPVQFFDCQLPGRPTFAIDLAPFTADRPRSADERCNSSLPESDAADQGRSRRTARWTSTSPLGKLASFGIALVNTARTWVDEASLVMPGYRDRVVTVFQEDKTEGGLNLSMDKAVVDRLSLRGRFAAQRLVQRFGPDGQGWPNHRWIRFRTATAALSDWLAGFGDGYTNGDDFYTAMLSDTAKQPSYPIADERLVTAQQRIADLRTQIRGWAEAPADVFVADRPLQPPLLRLVPPANEAEGSSSAIGSSEDVKPGGDVKPDGGGKPAGTSAQAVT